MIAGSRARRGVGMLELLIAAGILVLILGFGWMYLSLAGKGSTSASAHAGLQAGTQKALLELTIAVQQSIELVRPAPGTSLSYFVARGHTNERLIGYQVQDIAGSRRAGKPLWQLVLGESSTRGKSQRVLISGIQRLEFTSTSPGLLQVHLDLFEDGRSFTMLSTVRLGNLASEAAL